MNQDFVFALKQLGDVELVSDQHIVGRSYMDAVQVDVRDAIDTFEENDGPVDTGLQTVKAPEVPDMIDLNLPQLDDVHPKERISAKEPVRT
jgi:hypothetical protein